MANGSRYYRALESVSIASALSTALTIPIQDPSPSNADSLVLNSNFLQLGRRRYLCLLMLVFQILWSPLVKSESFLIIDITNEKHKVLCEQQRPQGSTDLCLNNSQLNTNSHCVTLQTWLVHSTYCVY